MQLKLINSILIITLMCLTKQSKVSALEVAVVELPEKNRIQLDADVYMIKTGLRQLQLEVDLLNGHLEDETAVIHSVKSHVFGNENLVEQCEMTQYFQDIDKTLNKMKYKIHQVVNDHDDEHLDKLEKIMYNAKKASHDCSLTENEDLTALKAQIMDKFLEFDALMAHMQELEDKLTSSPASDEVDSAVNADLTNQLNEINTKLNVQQEQLVKLETLIPDLQNATLSIETYKTKQKAMCNKKSCISKKILELTQNAPIIHAEKNWPF